MNNTKKVIVGVVILALLIVGFFLLTKKDEYKITYQSGDSTTKVEFLKQGNKIVKPADPVREGYRFIEWQLDGRAFDFSQEVKGDITLVAVWEKIVIDEPAASDKEVITVTFNSDGGSVVSSQKIQKGQLLSKPVDPTKEGYKFLGWMLDSIEYDFNTSVEKDMTLIAKWEKEGKKYTVTFDSDGGSKISKQEVNEDSTAKKPTNPTKNGYAFIEWQLNGKTYKFNTKITKDITLVAKFRQLKKYTVTFNSSGGTSVSKQTVYEDSTVKKPSNPTKSGYVFVEWQLNGKTYDFGTKVTKDITLVAKFRDLKDFTVTFNSNGGSSVPTKTVKEGSKVSKPSNPTKGGNVFVEWQLNGKAYDFNKAVTSNITLTAKWKQSTYTIKATKVDEYSPDRVLTVYENGSKITVNSIKYSDGTLLCKGNNTTVNVNDIKGESSFKVVLSGGAEVTARLN